MLTHRAILYRRKNPPSVVPPLFGGVETLNESKALKMYVIAFSKKTQTIEIHNKNANSFNKFLKNEENTSELRFSCQKMISYENGAGLCLFCDFSVFIRKSVRLATFCVEARAAELTAISRETHGKLWEFTGPVHRKLTGNNRKP